MAYPLSQSTESTSPFGPVAITGPSSMPNVSKRLLQVRGVHLPGSIVALTICLAIAQYGQKAPSPAFWKRADTGERSPWRRRIWTSCSCCVVLGWVGGPEQHLGVTVPWPYSGHNTKSTGMNSYHICTACRRRLTKIRPLNPSQWIFRATFISFNSNKPRITIDETTKTGDNASAQGEEEGATKERSSSWNPLPRRRIPRAVENKQGDILESLFEQTLSPKSTEDGSLQPQFSLEPYQNAETLKKMLEENSSVGDSWHFFMEHFGPDIWLQNRQTMPSYVNTPARLLLRQLTQAKSRDPFSKTLPTVSELSWAYLKLGLLHGQDWADLVFILIENIIILRRESLKDLAREERILMDLLGAWNVICRQSDLPSLSPSPDDPTSYNWSSVPHISKNDVVQTERKRGTLGGALAPFALLAPSFPFRQLNSIPLITVATFVLLEKDLTLDKSTILDAAPFLSALRNALGGSGYDVSQLFEAAHGPGVEAVSDFVVREWPMVRDTVLKKTEPQKVSAPASEIAQDNLSAKPYMELDLYKRLENAFKLRDGPQVDRLWANAMELPVSQDSKQDDASSTDIDKGMKTLSPKLYNFFIMAYMGLRKPNRAIDVWNHMVGNGLTPNVKTWTSMLSGCKVARDKNALESIWERMQKSQVKPDVPCWTARISGLIDLGRPEAGLEALSEMGHLWMAANRRKKGNKKPEVLPVALQDAVKPTIETINAAISGLLRKRKDEAASRVLDWANKLDIRPDAATFNILLRPLIRDGRSQEVKALLQQMHSLGIPADTTTFTVILEETFRNIGDQSPERLVEIVSGIFSEMSSVGIEASLHTYSRVIYQLLQIVQEDMTAVNAVLERMAKQGLQASPHIYTMLIEHHFSLQPPNLDAVRNLVDAARLRAGSTDNVFWDRVIEGYARAGDTASALRILGKLNDKANEASYYTLRTLLVALVQNQELDLARTLVQNTRIDRGGPLPASERGKDGQHEFWALARELHMLEV
ncbi:Pentatricopeptide repeat-containing protein, mitochondrial [Lachnellula hyalina]|uniref:Pentatricopeptide repeat-containing protein, mitochondrial n=1 Tax=Lachnellula hyalina TaxID=1316788 RepID=A0A8H8R6C9_9HELO|nr:Pentatricopeptide repeat-containing protein, mitochondrial [Lachnellula hyalina]TVY29284.1 Pentatricopeptide repeat-containing protein, mitochondrial [Lachnellula hyalina]